MFWAVTILIILAVLYLFYRFKTAAGKNMKSQNNTNLDNQLHSSLEKEAEKIVEKIATEKELEKLEEQRDKAQTKVFNAKTDRAAASAERKCEILDRAIDLAYNKPLAYQYVPELGLSTPSFKLEAAFQVFSLKNIDEAKGRLGKTESEWIELTYGDEPEESQPELKELRKFREIAESDLPDNKKSAKINRLVKKSGYLMENFFYEDDEFSAWDQWKIHVLEDLGVPAAADLYRAGFRTFIDCLKIDPAELKEIDGIGPKTEETFIKFLSEARKQKG